MRNRKTVVSILAAALLLGYVGMYAGLRCRHSLVRTGVFNNSRLVTGGMAPDAGWFHTDIERPAGSTDGAWVRGVFLPVIAVERVFWNTIGRQLRDPG